MSPYRSMVTIIAPEGPGEPYEGVSISCPTGLAFECRKPAKARVSRRDGRFAVVYRRPRRLVFWPGTGWLLT